MSPGSSRLLAVAALLAAGCQTREPDTRPFHIRVEEPGGGSIVARFGEEGLVNVRGTAVVEGPTALLLQGAELDDGTALGEVRIRFDGSAATRVTFDPERLGGNPVRVRLRVAPGATGPSLEPLTIPGLRIFADDGGAERSVFLLWEGTYPLTRTARVLSPAAPDLGEPVNDGPNFFVEEQWSESDPAECGLVYYDNLIVGTAEGAVAASLRRGEREEVVAVEGLSPWIIEHVTSWHRDGRCEGQSAVYTQLAGWRPVPVTSP